MTTPSPGGVQRWEMTMRERDMEQVTVPRKAPDGDWVRYGDHVEALIARAIDTSPLFAAWGIERKLLEKAIAENARLRKALEEVLSCYSNDHRPKRAIREIAREALRGAAGEA